jgi:hypothetical protein
MAGALGTGKFVPGMHGAHKEKGEAEVEEALQIGEEELDPVRYMKIDCRAELAERIAAYRDDPVARAELQKRCRIIRQERWRKAKWTTYYPKANKKQQPLTGKAMFEREPMHLLHERRHPKTKERELMTALCV